MGDEGLVSEGRMGNVGRGVATEMGTGIGIGAGSALRCGLYESDAYFNGEPFSFG